MVSNIGCILQAYALQEVIRRKGYDVETFALPIDEPLYGTLWLQPLRYLKRLVKKLLFDHTTVILQEQKSAQERAIECQYTERFIKRHMQIRRIKSLKEIKPADYDVIVVGSDQIWRRPYFNWPGPFSNSMLAFTKKWNVRRIAYAASFGKDNVDDYSPKDLKECKEALKLFEYISVREDSGVDICRNVFDVAAEHVLDPTLLLSKRDYESLIDVSEEADRPSEGDLLCYILDDTSFKTNLINNIAEEKALTPFSVNFPDALKGEKVPPQIPVERWLKGFKDAKFVVTDSFHACVFSIIFEVPFLVVGNAKRGMSRFTSLLKHFGLEDRLILPPA